MTFLLRPSTDRHRSDAAVAATVALLLVCLETVWLFLLGWDSSCMPAGALLASDPGLNHCAANGSTFRMRSGVAERPFKQLAPWTDGVSIAVHHEARASRCFRLFIAGFISPRHFSSEPHHYAAAGAWCYSQRCCNSRVWCHQGAPVLDIQPQVSVCRNTGSTYDEDAESCTLSFDLRNPTLGAETRRDEVRLKAGRRKNLLAEPFRRRGWRSCRMSSSTASSPAAGSSAASSVAESSGRAAGPGDPGDEGHHRPCIPSCLGFDDFYFDG